MAVRRKRRDGSRVVVEGGWEFRIPRPGRYCLGTLTVAIPSAIALLHKLLVHEGRGLPGDEVLRLGWGIL
jgi:hypothetical protein